MFIIIDPITNNTCGVGMIIMEANKSNLMTTITAEMKEKMTNSISVVTKKERELFGGNNSIIFAKDTFAAYMIERRLFDNSIMCVVVNYKELNISIADATNVAKSLSKQGLCVVAISEENNAVGVTEIDDVIKNII